MIAVFSCKQERTPKNAAQMDSSLIVNTVFSVPDISEETLQELFDLQQKVNNNPGNLEYRKQLISKSYYKDNNALITFGCARKTHPATGKNIAQALLKRAAAVDAKRWAAYGQTWILNNYMPDFGKLNSTFGGMNREITSFNSGDSLVIAFAHNINKQDIE